ncbi:MAG: hypothetical protein U1A78_33145 [Polyangia bacterium]
MQSLALLKDLERLPSISHREGKIDARALLEHARKMDRDLFAIEIGLGVEDSLIALFDRFNVPDDLQQAYHLAFSSSSSSLIDHFSEVSEKGESATKGFISCLKGKLAELRAPEVLKEHFPDHDFSLADSPINPDWDLHGVAEGANDLFIQVKMGTANYAGSVVQAMGETPDTLFAVSTDIFDKITETHPELGYQLIDLQEFSEEFTGNVTENVDLLMANHGIDVPDSIGDFLPYVGEVILGIRLLVDIVSVEKEFKAVSLDNRARVHTMKAIALLSRFGVTTVCTTVAGAAGTAAMPGAGSIAGAVAGAIIAGKLNKRLKPRMLQVAMQVAGVTQDDLFYFRNKPGVDLIGASLANTNARLATWIV